jgi:hypothetical protein
VKQIAAALNAKFASAAIRAVQTDLGQYGTLAQLSENSKVVPLRMLFS